jgi:hypothetical protein
VLGAVPRGPHPTTLKKQAQAALLDSLDQLVALIEAERLPEDVLTRAGFVVIGPRRRHAGTELAVPWICWARALGNGVLELKFRHAIRTQVRSHMFEWSADEGTTWIEGATATRSPVRLEGLPQLHKVLVRMCSLGSHGRRSAWTAPFEAAVL